MSQTKERINVRLPEAIPRRRNIPPAVVPGSREAPRSSGDTGDDGADVRAMGAASVKAGLIGAVGMVILLLINQVNLPLLPCLVVPGIILVLLVTGMLAGLLAGDYLKTRGQAMRVGVAAGFIAGLGAGCIALVLAAFGLMLSQLGDGVLAQLSPSQLKQLAQMGVVPNTVRVAGAVLAALLLWGVGGTIIGMILGALGSRLYFRIR
jgi:hypothetical protein